MKKCLELNVFNSFKKFSKFLPFLILPFFFGCKQDQIKFGQLQYEFKNLNKWLIDSNKYKGIVFQFYNDNKNDGDKVFECIAYVFDSSGKYVNASEPDTLRIIPNLKDSSIVFSEKFVLGNSGISLKKIRAIINANKDTSGQRLLFLPRKDSGSHHVFYNITYRTSQKKEEIGNSDPCPPLVCNEIFD